jgi:hypothetical protein
MTNKLTPMAADDTTYHRALVASDYQALIELQVSYCSAVDRGDIGAIDKSFHHGAIDEHVGITQGFSDRTIGETIVAALSQVAASPMHKVGTVTIKIDDDRAIAETYFLSEHRFSIGGIMSVRLRSGRYLDQCERRSGVWAIVHRVVVDDWAMTDQNRNMRRGPQ